MGLGDISEGAAALLSGGLSFLGNLGGSVGGGLFSANQARKNRQFQERMYNKQVEDNLNFWNMQNEYNLPSAQRQRLEDAGLNPLLMYGEGGVQNVANSQVQAGTAPHGAQGSVGSFNTRIDLANLALLRAQKENVDADTMLKTNEALKASAEKVKTYGDYEWMKDTWELRKDQISADTRLKAAFENTEVSKRNEIEANIDKAYKEIELYQSEIENKNKLTAQEIKESDQRIQNSIKETAAACAKMDAEARKAAADAIYSRAMAAIVGAPEYRQSAIKQKAEELRKAINDGNLSAIEAGLAAWMYDQRPKQGTNAYEWKLWLDHWVTPVTESLGKLLGGSATYSFPSKRGK